MIDLSKKHLKEVKSILMKFVPHSEVRVFGSRVTEKALKYSDLDLVICSDEMIQQKTIWKMEEAFSDSDLPFQVDILVWENIAESFRTKIEEQYEVI